jgi:hypothetical protein
MRRSWTFGLTIVATMAVGVPSAMAVAFYRAEGATESLAAVGEEFTMHVSTKLGKCLDEKAHIILETNGPIIHLDDGVSHGTCTTSAEGHHDFVTGGIQTMTAEGVGTDSFIETFHTFEMEIHTYKAHDKLCTYAFPTFSRDSRAHGFFAGFAFSATGAGSLVTSESSATGCKASAKTKIEITAWVFKAFPNAELRIL